MQYSSWDGTADSNCGEDKSAMAYFTGFPKALRHQHAGYANLKCINDVVAITMIRDILFGPVFDEKFYRKKNKKQTNHKPRL